MTFPTHDAQNSGPIPRRQQFMPSAHLAYPAHSISDAEAPSILPSVTLPMTPSTVMPPSAASSSFPASSTYSGNAHHEHAIDFATHSLDLATGGLKTLTAKRELPTRLERRLAENTLDTFAETRSYTFILAILVCIILMLIGGGVVLFVMIQP